MLDIGLYSPVTEVLVVTVVSLTDVEVLETVEVQGFTGNNREQNASAGA